METYKLSMAERMALYHMIETTGSPKLLRPFKDRLAQSLVTDLGGCPDTTSRWHLTEKGREVADRLAKVWP